MLRQPCFLASARLGIQALRSYAIGARPRIPMYVTSPISATSFSRLTPISDLKNTVPVLQGGANALSAATPNEPERLLDRERGQLSEGVIGPVGDRLDSGGSLPGGDPTRLIDDCELPIAGMLADKEVEDLPNVRRRSFLG